MEFILGALCGGLAMAAAVAVSITYDPYGKITEYRLMLDLEGDNDGNRDERIS